jgi:hypothetical protein
VSNRYEIRQQTIALKTKRDIDVDKQIVHTCLENSKAPFQNAKAALCHDKRNHTKKTKKQMNIRFNEMHELVAKMRTSLFEYLSCSGTIQCKNELSNVRTNVFAHTLQPLREASLVHVERVLEASYQHTPMMITTVTQIVCPAKPALLASLRVQLELDITKSKLHPHTLNGIIIPGNGLSKQSQ